METIEWQLHPVRSDRMGRVWMGVSLYVTCSLSGQTVPPCVEDLKEVFGQISGRSCPVHKSYDYHAKDDAASQRLSL